MSTQAEIDSIKKEMDECEKCEGNRMVMALSGYVWCSLCVMSVRRLNTAQAKLELSDMGAKDAMKVIRSARESVAQAHFMLECTRDDLSHIQNLVLKSEGYYPDDISVTEIWDCAKSPVGKCIYNHFEDPCHDWCLVCGDPEERK
jgi:hypothetical protein